MAKQLTMTELASMVAKREGLKSQVKIGDIREILKIICEIEAEDLVKRPEGEPYVIGLIGRMAQKKANAIWKKLEKKKGKK